MRSLVKLAISGAFVVSNGITAGYGLYKNYKQKKEFTEKEKEFKKKEDELRNDNKMQTDIINELRKQVEEYKPELEKGDILNVYNKLQEDDYSYFETFNTVDKTFKRVRKIRNTKKSVENNEMNQDTKDNNINTTKETNIDTQISKNTVKDSKKMYDAWRAKHTKTTEYDYVLNDGELYYKHAVFTHRLNREKDQPVIIRLAAIIINKLKEEIKIEKEFVESGKPWDLYFAQSFTADNLFIDARTIADIIDNEETSKEILDLLDKITKLGETYKRMHGKENKL